MAFPSIIIDSVRSIHQLLLLMYTCTIPLRSPTWLTYPTLLQTVAGNVCVRFLPVLDLLIHRYLELGSFAVHPLEAIMDHLSPIYRFHDHPVMYVYTTLHYYEKSMVEWPSLRKKLVATIIGALQDMKPLQRCVVGWGVRWYEMVV